MITPSPLSASSSEKEAVSLEAAELIRKFESSLDETLHLGGLVSAFLPQARRRIGVSGVVGQRVFEDAAELMGHLTRARASGVGVHNGLEAVRRMFGLPMMMAPEMKPAPSARHALRDTSLSEAA